MTRTLTRPGGLATSRRVVFVLLAALVAPSADRTLDASDAKPAGAEVTVREHAGLYRVQARFTVPQPTSTVLAVVTDYDRIPTFMPQVKTSIVRERSDTRAVVEQEAVASMMMFSKRIHLLLEVCEGTDTVSFRDRSDRSFSHYEGSWRVAEENGMTVVSYELNAKPSFSVPEFLLKRLLKRDAQDMIERMKQEFCAGEVRAKAKLSAMAAGSCR